MIKVKIVGERERKVIWILAPFSTKILQISPYWGEAFSLAQTT